PAFAFFSISAALTNAIVITLQMIKFSAVWGNGIARIHLKLLYNNFRKIKRHFFKFSDIFVILFCQKERTARKYGLSSLLSDRNEGKYE
ncbi:MAG TPA: hypothetical protein DEO95_06020, partial [Ruminococcaceae bacterium]|nr:hypothetical protein [Oscillospiraceae bacterium]